MFGEYIAGFFGLVASGEVEVYNEFSLQHEFGSYLRSKLPSQFKVQFERPVGFFRLKVLPYVKKEIDLAIFSPDHRLKVAVEFKFPRNGQYPEQMFKACQDIAFIEQLVAGGFDSGTFIMLADDPLFFSGEARSDLYRCFRAGHPIAGSIQKPTGARDEAATISGSYTISWTDCAARMKFTFLHAGNPNVI